MALAARLDSPVERWTRRAGGWSPEKVAPYLAVLLAFALQSFRLASKELTIDEVGSVFIVCRRLREMLPYLMGATYEHPPLYYIALHLWVNVFGWGDYSLRFLSVAFALLGVPLLFRLVRRLMGPGEAAIAAGMLAMSTFYLHHAQSARMYSLASLWTLLSLSFFESVLRRESWRGWLLYAASVLALVGTHYYGALVVLSQNLYLLLFWRSHRLVARKFFLVQAPLIAAALGWAVVSSGFRDTMGVVVGSARHPLPELLAVYRRLLSDFTLGQMPASDLSWKLTRTFLPLVLLGALSLAWSARKGDPTDPRLGHGPALLLLYFAVPPLVSGQLPYPVAPRLLLFVLPGYVSLLASSLAWGLRGWKGPKGALRGLVRVLALAYLAYVLAAFGYGLSFYFGRLVKWEYKGVVEEIIRHSRPGDAIVLDGPLQELNFRHYYRGELPRYSIPPSVPPPLEPAQAEPVLRDIASRHSRVWLVLSAENAADPGGFVYRWLAGSARSIYYKDLIHARLRLFEFPEEEMVVASPPGADFAGILRLAGLKVNSWELAAGEALKVDLSWEALAPPKEDYKVSLRLADMEGSVWAQRDSLLQAGLRYTSQWTAGERATSYLSLPLPAGMPPGEYRLRLVVYPAASPRALPVAGSEGRVEEEIALGSLRLRGRSHAVPEGVRLPGVKGPSFGDEVALVGWEGLPREAWPGEELTLLLYWRSLQAVGRELSLGVEMVSRGGQVVASWEEPVGASWYGPSQWAEGEVVLGRHTWKLPARLAAGSYRVRLAVYDGRTGQRLPAKPLQEEGLWGRLWRWDRAFAGEGFILGELRVKEREHLGRVPAIEHPLLYRFGDGIELLGYSLASAQVGPGEEVALALYWRARKAPQGSYKVFTHLLDAGNALRSQGDSIPLGGARPTDSWQEGEVLVDEYRLPIGEGLIPGRYWLAAGMYAPETGERLPAEDEKGQRLPEDRVLLGTMVEVVGGAR